MRRAIPPFRDSEKNVEHGPSLTVFMLGNFVVYRGSKLITEEMWTRRKAKHLFKLLLLAPNRHLLISQVVEWLWPEQEPERATNNLHRTVYVLRRILEPSLKSGRDSKFIIIQDGAIFLSPSAQIWVDIDEFIKLIEVGRQNVDPLSHFELARDLYKGELLKEDIYEDWTNKDRLSLHEIYCNLVREMAQLYLIRGNIKHTIECLQDLLEKSPFDEDVYSGLMQLLVFSGQRNSSLQLYRQIKDLLHQELGVEPSPETHDLFQAILENRWGPESFNHPWLNLGNGQPPSKSQIDGKYSTWKDPQPPILTTPSNHFPKPETRPVFVGRLKELEKLSALLSSGKRGEGNLVIISGERGVGKTRLALEFLEYARTRDCPVQAGASYEHEASLPYGPFVEIIRNGISEPNVRARLKARLGLVINDLARLLPELGTLSQPSYPLYDMMSGQERQRLFEAVINTLVILAQDSCLVVFIDDLHAAGESSFQLLHYIARRISSTPVLLICAIREEEVKTGTSVDKLYREVTKHNWAEQIKLSRLNPEEAEQLCAAVLGKQGLEPAISQTLSKKLYHLTEGNPFYLQEIVLALIQSGKIERLPDGSWNLPRERELTIPKSVRDVIGYRLGNCSKDAQRLAGLAAVVGLEFDYQILKSTLQWSETILLDSIEELLSASLIDEIDLGYRFHHSVTRQAIYDELAIQRRIWLHNQVAQTMEEIAPNHVEEISSILAFHYEKAQNYEMAFHYLIQAGYRAQTTYAPQEALEFYNNALALYSNIPELADIETLTDLLQKRAQAYLTLSDFEAAIGDLEQLLIKSQETENRLREGETLYQLGIAHYWAHRLSKASDFLNQAFHLAEEEGYSYLFTRIQKLRDIISSTLGNFAQSPVLGETFPPSDQAILPVEEHWGLALINHLHSNFKPAIYHAQRCIELGHSFGNPFLVLGGYFVLGMSWASLGQFQTAWEKITKAIEISETTGDRFWRARFLNTLGWVYRELFILDKAIYYDQASLYLARAGTPLLTEAEGNALANLATDYLLLNNLEKTKHYLDEGLKTRNEEPFMRWRYQNRMVVLEGRLALARGDISGALAAADEAEEIANRTQTQKNIARAFRLRGEALLAANEKKKGEKVLLEALALGESLKCPAIIWPTLLALAQFKEKEDKPRSAAKYYARVRDIFRTFEDNLTNPELKNPFLSSTQVRMVIAKTGEGSLAINKTPSAIK